MIKSQIYCTASPRMKLNIIVNNRITYSKILVQKLLMQTGITDRHFIGLVNSCNATFVEESEILNLFYN